ncbi:hypothetical protein [Bacteroides sp. 224]|uniref:hypothetical protein n=1 Tax=Bacteroides sp. 224 TaxID=2302936 RepID=UPI0013D84AB2|nr:hypothetical protein [Bacteroides sp. 224]NDV63960.1 hypothetical protein [Bacteroides sp. 224]
MLPHLSGKPIDLTCNELALPEFPDMLFGTSVDNGIFFNATVYIQKKQPSLKINDFFKDYKAQIESLCKAYQLNIEDICKLNKEGHVLIDGTFVYLFISFVEPDFLAYMCERINDLFTTGFCVSDTQILNLAKTRLPQKTVLEKIVGNEQIR